MSYLIPPPCAPCAPVPEPEPCAPVGLPLAPGALARIPFPSARGLARGGSSSEAACRPPGAVPTCWPRPVPRAKRLGRPVSPARGPCPGPR
eukprot:scaffold21928_cov32-Phaeocystis_antarctica.AAC.2